MPYKRFDAEASMLLEVMLIIICGMILLVIGTVVTLTVG